MFANSTNISMQDLLQAPVFSILNFLQTPEPSYISTVLIRPARSLPIDLEEVSSPASCKTADKFGVSSPSVGIITGI